MSDKYKLSQISKYLSPVNQQQQPKTSSQPTTPVTTKSKLSSLDSTILSQPAVNSSSKSSSSKYFQLDKQINCPICLLDIGNLSELNQQYHIDECLNKPAEVKEFKCPLCTENLTKLDDKNRQQHVNQCLDKGFAKTSTKSTKAKKQKSEEEQTPKINNDEMLENAVPPCPICGKSFQSLNTRQNHMKKCAKTFHIKTESLVDLVKKQQEGLERDLAKGIIPTGVYFIKKKPAKAEKIKKTTESDGVNQSQIILENDDETAKKELKIAKKKEKSKKNANKSETVLQTTTDEQREKKLTKRFNTIISNQIKYDKTAADFTTLISTRFKASDNSLWNKCKYFEESEESFYVKVFLESGKFLVGHQVFADKPSRYSNVELLNTQTAFLLADLNEQTQENMSVYYTQLEASQSRLDYTQLNSTQFNKTTNEMPNQTQSNEFSNQSQSEITMNEPSNQTNTYPEDCYWQPEYSQKYTQVKDESESNKSLGSTLEEIGLEEEDQMMNYETVEQKLSNEPDIGIIIDETIMSSSSNSATNSPQSHKTDSDSINSKDSNILDQNLDTLELDSNVSSSNDVIDLDENNEDKDLVSFLNNTTELSILDSSNMKKRKSINITELNESNCKKFKKDILKNSDSSESIQFIDEKKEDIHVIADETESSESLPSIKFTSPDRRILEDKNDDSDSCKIVDDFDNKCEEILECNNESNCEIVETKARTSGQTEAVVLKMIEKSLNQTKNNADFDDENALDEVWNNFEENNFDDFYNYNNNIENNNNNSINTNNANENDHETVDQPNNDGSIISNNYNTHETSINNDQDSNELADIVPNRTNHYQSPLHSPQQEEEEMPFEPAYQTPILAPINQNKQINRIKNIQKNVDLNVTPMPEYTEMDTPNLKGELKRFGIKPLSKKQAVKKLVEIYEFTHRNTLKRSASCLDGSTTSRGDMANREIENAAKQMNLETNNIKAKKSAKSLKKTVSDIGFQRHEEPMPPPPAPTTTQPLIRIGLNNSKKKAVSKATKSNKSLQDQTIDDHMLALANADDSDSDTESASQMSTQQKANRKKKTIEEDELKEFLYDYIRNDENIYLDALNYIPLDYESLLNQLQVALAPRKVNNKLLMKILDEFCVTFTLKSLNTRGNLKGKPQNNKKKT